MLQLKDKSKTTLDEGRMLILGAQVLVGLQFRSALEQGFEQLPKHAQYLKLGGLSLLLVVIALLMSSGAYHQIVDDGEDTHELHRFATVVMCSALLPFALGITGDFFIVARKITESKSVAAIMAALALILFYGLWFGYTLYLRKQRPPARRWQSGYAKR